MFDYLLQCLHKMLVHCWTCDFFLETMELMNLESCIFRLGTCIISYDNSKPNFTLFGHI